MDTLYLSTVRNALLSINNPTDRDIVNAISKYLFSTMHNTMIINASKPQIDDDNSYIKILYVDVECLSWSELNNIITHLSSLECLIVRVNSLIGGTNRLLSLIDNSNLKLFVVLVNGTHCSNIVNSSMFLSDWSAHVPINTLHVYYQRDSHTALDKTQLDNLLILNCRPMEPIESIVHAALDIANKDSLNWTSTL